ncbi:MAG: DNA repair protein RadA [Candidatus Hydrogenedens sp.]
MAHEKKIYECSECGFESPKWLGKCPQCESWNPFLEKITTNSSKNKQKRVDIQPISIFEKNHLEEQSKKIPTGIKEFDRVVGGGIIQGAVILIGGEPGIGKSTLVIQTAGLWARINGPVLYIHGEESFHQVKERAQRVNAIHPDLFMFPSTDMSDILSSIDTNQYSLVIIDSIQSISNPDVDSLPGSITQVRECTYELVQKAKQINVPMIIIGHITKEGYIAGPKVLEHIVDTVLYFEGEGKHSLRVLRAIKNRFGSTHEIGVFEMCCEGLKEIADPSAIFLQERSMGVSGSIVFPMVGGSRPLLVEIQSLVGKSRIPQPRRGIMGLNSQRIALLVAILEKKAGIYLSDRDIFVNVAGGVFVEETAVDLPVVISMLSSFWDLPIPSDWITFGEVGLAGEIRRVNGARIRLNEIAKFGFKTCIIPRIEPSDIPDKTENLQIISLENIKELNPLFENREKSRE